MSAKERLVRSEVGQRPLVVVVGCGGAVVVFETTPDSKSLLPVAPGCGDLATRTRTQTRRAGRSHRPRLEDVHLQVSSDNNNTQFSYGCPQSGMRVAVHSVTGSNVFLDDSLVFGGGLIDQV